MLVHPLIASQPGIGQSFVMKKFGKHMDMQLSKPETIYLAHLIQNLATSLNRSTLTTRPGNSTFIHSALLLVYSTLSSQNTIGRIFASSSEDFKYWHNIHSHTKK